MHFIEQLSGMAHTFVNRLDLLPFGKALFSGRIDIGGYAAFLIQTYHYVRHTRPLLRHAGMRLNGDLHRKYIATLFLQKAEEENGHEQWILSDLQALGLPLDDVLRADPEPSVTAYLTWNTYNVERGSPISYLGTAYILEALSAARAASTSKNLIERSGILCIERATCFLRGHADADDQHKEHLESVLLSATSDEDRQDILSSASVTCSVYRDLFRALGQPAVDTAETDTAKTKRITLLS